MQRAQIPSERLLVVQIDEAVPGAVGGGSIDSREADAGDDLQDEHDQRRAAEDVPPARRAARHGMLGDLGDRLADLQTRVEPSADRFESFNHADGWPSVGKLAGVNPKLAGLDFVFVLIQRTRRRSRSVPAVGVECAAVAWAHEQFGFGEPSHRASQMRAVDGEDLELVAGDVSHPAGDFGGLAVPGFLERVYILGQARLIFWIVSQRSERYPVEPGEAPRGR